MERTVLAISELYKRAQERLRAQVTTAGKLDRAKVEQHQVASHALAYLAAELEASRQTLEWSKRVGGELEHKIAAAYIGEVARALSSSIELGACESVDVHELGVSDEDLQKTVLQPAVLAFIAQNARSERYLEIAAQAKESGYGALGLQDSTLEDVRAEFAR